jgi:hypothetical protein
MGERGGKTISMNDEIPPVYMVSKGSQRTSLLMSICSFCKSSFTIYY